jgi:hypothetical protein
MVQGMKFPPIPQGKGAKKNHAFTTHLKINMLQNQLHDN